jgi:hypothetical protein
VAGQTRFIKLMKLSFENQVALATGAASGMGLAPHRKPARSRR